MSQTTKVYPYNYDKGDYDALDRLPLDDMEAMLPYLPNHMLAYRELFKLYVTYKGMSVADAYIAILSIEKDAAK